MSAADTPSYASPRQVLERFFEAERRYMQEAGSFEELRAILADDVVLHQSPDLPWGGEYAGPGRYEEWARAMNAVFDQVDIQNPQFFEQGDTVVIVGTLVTRLRATGETMELPMAQMVRSKGKNHRVSAFLLERARVRRSSSEKCLMIKRQWPT